jgi:hypothetical protein
MLLTVDELKTRAEENDVDLDPFTDDRLTEMIGSAQAYIELHTGRIFDSQSIVDDKFFHTGSLLQLEQYPVLSVEKVEISGIEVDVTGIKINYRTGELYIPHNFRAKMEYDIHVEYTGCYESPYPPAKDLCAELVFVEVSGPADGKDISKYKDGGLSGVEINYFQKDFTQDLRELRRTVFGII